MLINSPSTDANMPYGLPAGFGQNNGVMIGNTEFRAASAQDLQNALDFVAAKASKPVDELTYTDMLRAFSYKAFTNRLACAADNTSASWIVDLGTAVHGTAQSSSTVSNNFAQQEYFGEVIPMYTQHLASYFSWGGFNPQLSGLSASLQAGAVASVGKALYSDNYGGVTPALDAVDPSTLDPSVTALLGQMFGADTAFDVGHMNALKLLGLLQGNASAGPESWQLSLDGQTVLAGMRGSDTRFVPDMALFNIGSAGTAIMDNASGYFNDSGFAPGFDSGFLESQATTLYQEFAGNDSPEISQLSTSADATALLNDLFKLPQGNTSFSNAQINTAIGLGLLNYDGAHCVSVAKNGNLYLQDLAAQAEAKKQAELKAQKTAEVFPELDKLNQDLQLLSDNWGRFASGDRLDNRIFYRYKSQGNFNHIDDRLYQLALDMCNYTDSGLLTSLYRGNRARTDGVFSRDEFNTFFSGTKGLEQVLTNPDGTANRDRAKTIKGALQDLQNNYGLFDIGRDGRGADGIVSSDGDVNSIMNFKRFQSLQGTASVINQEYNAAGGWLRCLVFGGDNKMNYDDFMGAMNLLNNALNPAS